MYVPNTYCITCIHLMCMDEIVTIRAPAELVEQIDNERAKAQLVSNDRVSRSEWFRKAARKKLECEG